ncbi:MAG: hypothetical protein PF487_08925 [Bacteroidales bacterium]|jgi:hypothetical protein|nr:hypothetical protein [Bacteroidales bacterium]
MSEVSQNTVGEFVGREVYSNVGDKVQALIDAQKFDLFEYMTPRAYYNNEECTQEEIDLIINEKNIELDQLNDKILEITSVEEEADLEEMISQLEEDIEELGDLDFDDPEPLEYWIVSPFLAEKLKDRGQVIIDEYMSPIWGRESSGQAILLDGVIVDIVKSLNII